MEISEDTAREILRSIPMQRDISDIRSCARIVLDLGLYNPETEQISYNGTDEQTDNPDGASS